MKIVFGTYLVEAASGGQCKTGYGGIEHFADTEDVFPVEGNALQILRTVPGALHNIRNTGGGGGGGGGVNPRSRGLNGH